MEFQRDSNSYSSSSSRFDQIQEECKELSCSLPTGKVWMYEIILYQGCWLPSEYLSGVIAFQRHFQARQTDIILASFPKSGTTWLKALLFTIVNRSHYSDSNSPLFTSNPHELVPFLEFQLYANKQLPDLEILPSPRLFATHMHFEFLPQSIKCSNSKIVYIFRNPFDAIVSAWHFYKQVKHENIQAWTMEEFVDSFCSGTFPCGPWWESVLGYWKKSLEMPHKILFLKYEDMKNDPIVHLKKLAEFVGFPFSAQEEKDGVIESISNMCSLRFLKNLEVNKNGEMAPKIEKKSFFRKGEVGDWVNHLNFSMVERLETCMKEKLSGSGLTFEVTLNSS